MGLEQTVLARYIPKHIAIIMDGNGRWAKQHGEDRIFGHHEGVNSVREIVEACGEIGIKYLTLYAFSTENWRRPADEVSDLMGLLRKFIVDDIDELAANGVRLRIIGDYQALKPDLVKLIDDAMARTLSNSRTTLVIALNYGSQAEIARAARQLAAKVAGAGMSLDAITPEALEAELYTADVPAPDLVIRTSGEQRLSNFLLWQAAYAEMFFIDTLWPDFTAKQFNEALDWFSKRDRRFGSAAPF